MSSSKSAIWLVTGASGQVGGALLHMVPRAVRIVAPNRVQLNLADPTLDVTRLLEREVVTAIVNCGAYTQVDAAEHEPTLARQVNGVAPGILARSAAKTGIPIIQVSTDYVFPGTDPGWYNESDPPAPTTSYGRSKLLGEEEVAQSGARFAIVRTSWVFGATGQNFMRTILRLGREREEVAVVDDQWGCPTHAGDLANSLATIASAMETGTQSSGIWHIANAGSTSWFGFARRILAVATQHGRRAPVLRPIPTAEYPTPAPRPANSKLSTAKAAADFDLRLRSWEEASDEAVGEICAVEGN